MMRLLSGPIEREELSRRMTPIDPSEPVVNVSAARSFVPTAAGRIFPPRLMVAVPAEVLTMPMDSWASAGRHHAKADNVNRRITMDFFGFMVSLLPILPAGSI